MATITIDVTLTDDDLAAGWDGDRYECAESIRAALLEVIGDDGNAYMPEVAHAE